MSKLTLPIICAYLPFEVKVKHASGIWDVEGILNCEGGNADIMIGNQGYFQTIGIADFGKDYSLFLRPLSSLTKPIHHNGETFVPLVKLASIQFPEVEFTIEDNRCFGRLNVGVVLEFVIDDEIPFYKEYHNNIFGQSKSDDYDDMTMANITPSEVREKLKEWHMDLWNLLESGDALPIEEDGK